MEKSDEEILPVGCREFHVCTRKFMRLLTHLFKGTLFGWQPSPLGSYQWFWDLPYHTTDFLSPDTEDMLPRDFADHSLENGSEDI